MLTLDTHGQRLGGRHRGEVRHRRDSCTFVRNLQRGNEAGHVVTNVHTQDFSVILGNSAAATREGMDIRTTALLRLAQSYIGGNIQVLPSVTAPPAAIVTR